MRPTGAHLHGPPPRFGLEPDEAVAFGDAAGHLSGDGACCGDKDNGSGAIHSHKSGISLARFLSSGVSPLGGVV